MDKQVEQIARVVPRSMVKTFGGIDFTHGFGRVLLQILPVVLVILVWWVVAVVMHVPRLYPTPVTVFNEFIGILGGKAPVGAASSYVHIGATLYRLFIAFLLSFAIGVVIGLIVGRNKLLFNLFDNIGWIFLSVPAILWSFIFVVALGLTEVVPVVVLMSQLAPQVALLTAEGAKATPADILEMSASYKATTWQKVKDVFLPHLIPYLVASARTSFSLGAKLVVIAEIVGFSTGIGVMIKYWDDKVQVAPLVAWGLVLIVVANAVEYAVFATLERRVAKWRTGPQVTMKGGGVA
ncbi:MAG: ABC transporter permease subunit [Chloroflexota bacterium]|nr:ABC transporter permease subunit [Chloroflexota bacterium]